MNIEELEAINKVKIHNKHRKIFFEKTQEKNRDNI